MLIHKPKNFDRKNSPAYFYAHGGVGFAMSCDYEKPVMSHLCVKLNCVIFNINYRKGPEVKCP